VNQPLQRKNRLTGQTLGPASNEAQQLADLDRALKSGLSSAANAVGSIPEGYNTLMDSAPGHRWDPTLGGAQALGDLIPMREGVEALGRGGNAGLDAVQQALVTGLDYGGFALESADDAAIRAILAGGQGIGTGAAAAGKGIGTGAQWAGQGIGSGASAGARGLAKGVQAGVGGMLTGGEAAGTGIADFAVGAAGAPMRNLRAGADFFGVGAGADTSQNVAHALSNPDINTNDYIQMLLKKKDLTPAEKEALTEYLMNGGINRSNDIMIPPEIMSGQYDPYNPEHSLDTLRQANRDLSDNRAPLPGATPQQGVDAASTAVTETDPNRARPLDNRDEVLQRMEQERMAEIINQMFPTMEGGNAMGLAEQLAGQERGYAKGRYNDLTSYLDTERATRGAQFDSDEEAILGQLRQHDQQRRDTEDWYETKRKAEFGETERKLDARTTAASTRLFNLGIEPQKYTEVVGTEMGALLGAQMQSGSDLAHRMAQLGAERARLGMGRAKSGFAKERRQFDANASDMLFQGSQRLSYELQDIDKALMARRITAEEAKDASAAAANEARTQANRAMHLGSFGNIPGDVSAAASSFPGMLEELMKIAGRQGGATSMTITEGMVPPGFEHLVGQTLSLDTIEQIGDIGKQISESVY